MCVPVKIHADEGTGLRKAAVNQISWGPILSSSPNSLDRYFFWSCMNGEDYKAGHEGYEAGNHIMDELHEALVAQCRAVYTDGIDCPGIGRLRLIFVGLEGDLPAQARAFHVKRNFGCLPNACCPWCLADDRGIPCMDPRDNAQWRGTIGVARPWTTASPMHNIPGAGNEVFLAKDLFHLAHLGAIRGFAVTVLCYLTWQGHFVSWIGRMWYILDLDICQHPRDVPAYVFRNIV